MNRWGRARGRGGQRGQALVGALVVMLVLFALAGGIAVEASGLLQQSRLLTGAAQDFANQSASADAVSRAVGTASACTPDPGSGPPFVRISGTESAPLSVTYPDPTDAARSLGTSASCVRVDHVSSTLPNPFAIPLRWSSLCSTLPLPNRHVALLFDARWEDGAAQVYVDDLPTPSKCRDDLPGTVSCGAPSPVTDCVRCGKELADGLPLVQMTLDCDLGSVTSPSYLHVNSPSGSPLGSPARVFLADHDDAGGSMFLIAVRVGAAQAYEELALLAPASGSDRLLYKAPLPVVTP